MLVFCSEYTQHSKLAKNCLAELNDICRRDYGKPFFKKSIICLDLDAYEASLEGDNDATMDASTGVADWQRNHISGDRHLLVELRFGYRSIANFDFDKMKRKVAHSRTILAPERINEKVVFLYKPNVAALAQNYFSRLSKQDHEVKSWEAMDVAGLSYFVLDSSSLPYEPKTDLKLLEITLKNKYNSGGLATLDGLVEYWIEQIEQLNLKYMKAESNAIAEVILFFLDTLSYAHDTFEYEYISLWKEKLTLFVHPY